MAVDVVAIRPALLLSIHEDNNLRLFAIYMKLKSCFINSCFYNASYANMSRKSGISASVLKRAVPQIKALGWMRQHSNNLIVEKIRNIDKTKRFCRHLLVGVKIKTSEKYTEILKRLKLALVNLVYKKFEYVKKLSSDYLDPKKLDDYKKASKLVNRGIIHSLINANERFSISNRTIGNMLSRHKTTASRLMNWGQKKKILKKEKNISLAEGGGADYVGPGSCYFFFGKTLLVRRADYVRFY